MARLKTEGKRIKKIDKDDLKEEFCTCDLCGSEVFDYLLTVANKHLVQCVGCRTALTLPAQEYKMAKF